MVLCRGAYPNGDEGSAHAIGNKDVVAMLLIPAAAVPIAIDAGGVEAMPPQGNLPAVGMAADGQVEGFFFLRQ